MHFWIQHTEISKTHLFRFLPQKKSVFLQGSVSGWQSGTGTGLLWIVSGSETGWGGHSDGGTGFSASTSVFTCQYHYTNAQQLSLSTCCSYRKDNGRSLETLKKQVYFENRGELERIWVHFFHSLNPEIGHRISHCTSFEMGSSTVTLCVE
jgi:hypothetical protein